MIPASLPNIITLSRILLSPFMLLFPAFSWQFFLIYGMCGLSDLVDGFLARHFNLMTEHGARLDSTADAVFFLVLLIKLFSVLTVAPWMPLWVILIVGVKVLTLLIGFVRFQALAFIHTRLNKLSGLLFFLLPLGFMIVHEATLIILMLVVASFASLEEMCIVLLTQKLDQNQKSLMHSGRKGEASVK